MSPVQLFRITQAAGLPPRHNYSHFDIQAQLEEEFNSRENLDYVIIATNFIPQLLDFTPQL